MTQMFNFPNMRNSGNKLMSLLLSAKAQRTFSALQPGTHEPELCFL